MTNIAVTSEVFQYEKRGWLAGPHGTDPNSVLGITLDLTTATGGWVAATHYPNGYIPSGVVLGKITATGKYGVYDSAASDGRQTAAGILFGSIQVPASTATPVGAALVVHAFVEIARMPFQSGTGFAGTAAKASLNLIYWI